ncbi:putative RED-like protein [Helianthus annuus]|nr:putative RED-like protein [Helianthus annuus]
MVFLREMFTVSVDGSVLDRIGKIMSYLRLGSSGKILKKKKKKDKDSKGDYIVMMTQEEKDRGLGSVFKRDDMRLQQLREKDAREKDPNFISESYSECYPGYQEYNR